MALSRGPTVAEVREKYANDTAAWPKDRWHRHTRSSILECAKAFLEPVLSATSLIANVGSAGDDLGISLGTQVHVDITERRLDKSHSVVANGEHLPFQDNRFDAAICVGSVINFCDAALAVSELCRIVAPGGHLLLEFEVSESAEYLFKKSFGASASPVRTFESDRPVHLWVYSEEYVQAILHASRMKVVRRTPIHLLSPLVYWLTRSVSFAGWIGAKTDAWLRRTSSIESGHGNVIYLCRKEASTSAG